MLDIFLLIEFLSVFADESSSSNSADQQSENVYARGLINLESELRRNLAGN